MAPYNTPEGRQLVKDILALHGIYPHDYQLDGVVVSLDGESLLATMATGAGKTGFYSFLMIVMIEISRNPERALGGVKFPLNPSIVMVMPTKALQYDMEKSLTRLGLDCVVINGDTTKEAKAAKPKRNLFVESQGTRVKSDYYDVYPPKRSGEKNWISHLVSLTTGDYKQAHPEGLSNEALNWTGLNVSLYQFHMDSPNCANLVGSTIDIPPEVFLRICEFAVSGPNPLSPLFLGKICRAWRHLCYSTPSLWTQPKITFKADASQIILLKEWIHRAGDLPLNLHICDPTDFLNGRHEPPQCIPLLELMAEKAPQIRTFILEAPSASLLHLPRWNYSGPSFTSERYRWSILSRLHLSYVDDDIVPIFDNCPQLTDLGFDYSSHWHSTKSIVALPWISWKNLRRANFRGFGYDDLLRVLRKARDLETLHSTFVSNDTEYYGGGPTKDYWNGPGLNETPKPPRNLMIHHQKLKSWTFSQKTKQRLSFTFYNMMLLRLPALKTLNIHWEDSSKYGTYHRLAEATKGWDCALRQFEVSLVGFRQEYVAEWIKAPEMSTLRSLKLHWEHHGEHSSLELSSDLFVAMTASPGKGPILPKLRSLVVEDTPLGFSPDVIIRMLASRWDDGPDFPLKSCAISSRVSENSVWHVTEEHQTALRRWRERGYTVELGTSEGTVEEEEEEEEGERVADYMGREYIFRAV